MSEKKMRGLFHAAIDASLAGLKEDASLPQHLMDSMDRKEPVFMKKKITVALVLAVVLILAMAVALAVGLYREYFEQIGQMQMESGYYDDWTLEEKFYAVSLMERYDLLTGKEAGQIEAIKALPAQSQEAALDALMAQKYGINGRTDTIGLQSILEREKGQVVFWSVEDKAWYIDLLDQLGLLSDEEEQLYVRPGPDDMTQQEAEALARRFLMERTDWKEGLPAVNFTLVQCTFDETTGERLDETTWQITFYDADANTEIFLWMPSRKGTTVEEVQTGPQYLWESDSAPWVTRDAQESR